MSALAIKKGQLRKKAAGLTEMGTVRCDACGEEFIIGYRPPLADGRRAEKQARWLETVLAEEHERDKKHDNRIELPD